MPESAYQNQPEELLTDQDQRVKQSKLELKRTWLRKTDAARKKIQDVISELDLVSEVTYMSDSSDEYIPEQTRKCAVRSCKEDIFLACYVCHALLCYDHRESECTEHSTGSQSSTQENNKYSCESSEGTDSEDQEVVRKEVKRKKTVRRVRSDPNSWKRNRRKEARLMGKMHINTAGKLVAKKAVQECSCQHGRQKVFTCTEFSEQNRQQLLSEYYASSDYSRQRDFISNHSILISSGTLGRHKQRHIQFFLPLDNVRKRVCKEFFLTTLDISESLVWYTLEKKAADDSASFSLPDNRSA